VDKVKGEIIDKEIRRS